MTLVPMRVNPSSICAIVVGIVAATATSSSIAAARQLPELLVALSTARGEAVGRAHRIQACPQLRGRKVITDLVLKYDDARTSHNARIEAWVFALQSRQLSVPDIASEVQQLQTSRAKVITFTSAASIELTKAGCGTKVALQAWLLALLPVSVEKLIDYFQNLSADDKAIQETINQLEFYKIPPWESAGAIVVYDWRAEKYLTAGKFTAVDLRKGSTDIYVNKWALTREPNSLFSKDKDVPPALEGAYLLYTGPLEALREFTPLEHKLPAPLK